MEECVLNIISQIDPSAFACAPRMHHGEPTAQFPSSAGSRRRNLLALRGMMWGAAGGAPMPYDYAVEYIESNGNQYILTGIQNIKVGATISWMPLVKVTDTWMFGGDMFSDSAYMRIGCYVRNTYIINGIGVTADSISVVMDGDWGVSSFDHEATPRLDFQLFGGRWGGDVVGKISARLKSAVLTSAGAEICRLVPCVKDGVPCVYDSVRDLFLYDESGTGFVAGPRV